MAKPFARPPLPPATPPARAVTQPAPVGSAPPPAWRPTAIQPATGKPPAPAFRPPQPPPPVTGAAWRTNAPTPPAQTRATTTPPVAQMRQAIPTAVTQAPIQTRATTTPVVQGRLAPPPPQAPKPAVRPAPHRPLVVQPMNADGVDAPGERITKRRKLNPLFYNNDPFNDDGNLSDATEPDDDALVIDVGNQKNPKKKEKRKIRELFFNKSRSKGRKVNRFINAASNFDLEADAITIRNAIKDKKSRGPTTVVCVLSEKTKDGITRYVKLCYCNNGNSISTPMRLKAESLGYDFIQSTKAHAEAAAILHHKYYQGAYKIIAMGCDKPHCAECSQIMIRNMAVEEKGEGDNPPTQYIPTVSEMSNVRFPNYTLLSTAFNPLLGLGDQSRPFPKAGAAMPGPGKSTTVNFDFTAVKLMDGIEK